MATEHTLDRSHIHHDWDRGREPVLTIRTGDVVHLTCRSPRRARSRSRLRSRRSSGTSRRSTTSPGRSTSRAPRPAGRSRSRSSSSPRRVGLDRGDPGVRPPRERLPGCVFEDVRPPERPDREGGPRRRGPLEPCLGTMGVPIDEPGRVSPFPPHAGGGNVDCRHLVAGSTLWLPVWCEGALFSCGRRARRAARRRGVRHARCGTRSGSGTATGRSPGPLTRSRSRWGSPARTGARWASTPT